MFLQGMSWVKQCGQVMQKLSLTDPKRDRSSVTLFGARALVMVSTLPVAVSTLNMVAQVLHTVFYIATLFFLIV